VGYTGKLRLASFFNQLPDGRTEVVEEMTNPADAMMNNSMFWCMVLCTCGCSLCMVQSMLPRLRSQLETGNPPSTATGLLVELPD
jgi:hypothetical protein